jgi:hypothetical protein
VTAPAGDPATALGRLLSGFRVSQSISVAASLRVADALAAGPRNADDLAGELGANASALYRLLRVLAAAGVLHEDDGRRFSLAEMGQLLRSGVDGSVREQAMLFGRPEMLAAWGHLEHSIRTGENAFAALFGESVWEWRERDSAARSQFNRGMASISAPIGPALADAYDFGSVAAVADIGGGSGSLLAAVLARHPRLRGIVFDQPSVVSEAAPVLANAGVADRCELVGGSFFESVPAADLYLMKSILHDWTDADSIRILRVIRAAAPPGVPLLLVERVVGPPNDDLAGKLMDLHMLVMPGGGERTADEWRQLLAEGGFELRSIRPLVAGWQLIESA